ncbi:WD40-repeat-containing domain protein [Phlebopus sp. FC_14]|nr:WD40-repeat-containing domain protein [Phlebopus sp. FC_14]
MSAHSLPSENEAKIVPVKTFEGHGDWVQCVAWYPDGRRLVSGSDNGELRIWETETGLQVGEAIQGHSNVLWALDVSSDGMAIASGSWDKTVKLWHAETGELMHTCTGCKAAVRDVHFSPDSKRVASVSADFTMRIWDAKTGELALEPVECKDGVSAVRYSPNGDRVAAGGYSIRIWDVSGSALHLALTINESVYSLAWAYDGEQLIAGGVGKVTICNALSGEEIRSWEAHKYWIQLSLSPTTTHLVTRDLDAQHCVYDTETAERVTEYNLYRPGGHVDYVVYSPSGEFIATASDKRVHLWEAPSTQTPSVLRSPGSSMLDLPATTRPGEVQTHDQVIELCFHSSTFDLPAIPQPPRCVQPTDQDHRQLKNPFRGLVNGVFRRSPATQPAERIDGHLTEISPRNQPTRPFERGWPRLHSSIALKRHRGSSLGEENQDTPEGRTPRSNWIAGARTRAFWALNTAPFHDEIEHGWFFHLASYICFCQRDPNISPKNVSVSPPGSTLIGPLSTPIASSSGDPRLHPPTPSATVAQITSQTIPASSISSISRILLRLKVLVSSLRPNRPSVHRAPAVATAMPSPQQPASQFAENCPMETIATTIIPSIIISHPSSEPVAQPDNPTVALQEVSSSGVSSIQTVPSPVSLHRERIEDPHQREGGSGWSLHSCAYPTTYERRIEVFEDGFGLYENPWADPSSHLLSCSISDDTGLRKALQGVDLTSSGLSPDEIAVLEEYRWQKTTGLSSP